MTTRTVVPSVAALAAIVALESCEIKSGGGKPADTLSAADIARRADSAAAAAGAASNAVTDSTLRARASAGTDSGQMTIEPAAPQRGGVVFVHVDGVAGDATRCSWKGAPLPCYRSGGGVLAILPLPADEPAGTFSFTVDHSGGRSARQITVNDRPFGRELVFLDPALYALVSRRADVARDARAVRAVLAGESPERRWSGAWRDPVASSGKSAGYGVERFYYPVSDSTRVVSLDPGLASEGPFGTDTASAAPRGNVPSWRHAGIDLPARKGASVTAPAAGTVADVGDYVLTGHTLLLDHGQGVFTAYFHLDTVLVRRGDVVARGKTVARVGQTGLATGAHLHYGVYVHGKDVDPAAWKAMPAWVRSDSGAVAQVR